MRDALRKHHISFKNAWAGIVWALATQPNFRVHIALSLIALGLARYFNITKPEAIVIIFTIILGLAAEMINTSLECMTDLITTQWRKEAKLAKDVAAGMMLLVAIGAVVVAILIFGPYIIEMFRR
ncbi:diacylglycerol kinase family protein [Candidatus Gottesmanbacteria bacterium]|nr:diacylglycerol kinase family protein [Candidatus Gottesmanbacteria bacterium]